MPASSPVVTDVAALLIDAGADAAKVATLPIAKALAKAIEAFETDTGFKPFLATTGTGQHVEDYRAPRVATLELRTGFVSISSVMCRDEVLVEGEDFELRRFNGALRDAPFTEIKFFRAVRGMVLVAGVQGFCSSLSQTVFDAICAKAALFVVPLLTDAATATSATPIALKAKTVGDVRVEYTSAQDAQAAKLKAAPAQWQSDYDDAVAKHKLVVWGL